MENIIHTKIGLQSQAREAFEYFTQNESLERWLTNKADVEPEVGGKYELFWDVEDPEHNSTIGCRITALVPGRLLAFDWKGPVNFEPFMNNAEPLTHVTVGFFPIESGTEVHLVHTGWRESGEWPAAREYFDRAWSEAFLELQQLDSSNR